MAWTYSNWESQSTYVLKKSVLEQHIAEVSAELGPNLTTAGRARDNQPLVDYLNLLYGRLDKLNADVAIPDTSPRVRSMFIRGRPI